MNTPILKPSERLKVVDSLRGFALLAIVLLHNTSKTNGEILDELKIYALKPLKKLLLVSAVCGISSFSGI